MLRRELVAIHGRTQLKTVEPGRPGIHVGHPGPIVVGVATVSGFAQKRRAPVAKTEVVTQAQAARGNISFRLDAYKVGGNKRPAKLNHFRPGDRSLQPGAMVEGGIPISDRSMVFAERELEVVVVVVADDGTLHAQVVGARLRGETNFAEVADLF